MISINDLTYLDFINYPNKEIKEKMTFICGESGCGKTTLLRLLNKTISPSKGQILFNGQDINEIDSITLRRKILLVSQNVFLFEGTIMDNFNTYYEYLDKTISEEEAKKYLKICSIDFPLDMTTHNMSGGEKQRIFLAIGLSLKPEVILMDEPTSALDDKTAHQFMDNLKELDLMKIIVCHNIELAKMYAQEIIYLEKTDARNN